MTMAKLHPSPLPRVWLFTDPRNRARLDEALVRLPRGAGVVFRDGDLPREERRRHFRRVAALCRRRGLVLLVAGEPVRGDWRAQGRHNSRRRDRPIRSLAVHDAAETWDARRRGVDLCFVSPVHATRSHANATPLGRFGFLRLAILCPGAVVVLGGMTLGSAAKLTALGAYGWGAIDALSGSLERGHKKHTDPSTNPRNSDCN